MKVILLQEARTDLNNIVEYYRKKGQLQFGRKIRAKVILKTIQLKDFPRLGPIEEGLTDLNLGHRYLVEGNYKIIYRIDRDFALITNVFDTRQDPEKM